MNQQLKKEPRIIIVGDSGIGNVASLLMAIKETSEDVILIKDTDELREFVKSQHKINVEDLHLSPSVMKIEPPVLKSMNEVFIDNNDKPFYHNITNKRRRKK